MKVKVPLDFNQELIVNTLSNEHRLLYNHLLQSVKESPKTFKELNQIYKNYWHDNQLTISSKSAQNTCISFINSIKSFYSLHKKDKSHQFPYKFKSYKYFKSFMYDGLNKIKLKDNQLIVNLIGQKENAKKLIIELPEYCKDKINEFNIKTTTFKKEDDGYYLIFVYGEESSKKIESKDFLSIDLGYSQLVTCYSNNKKVNNFSVENLKLKKLQKTIEYLQAYKDKKVKGSKKYIKANRKYRKSKRKQADKQTDFQHKLSSKIIEICKDNKIGHMIIGDIQVKKVIKNKINELKKEIKESTNVNDIKKLTDLLEKEYNRIKINGLSKSTALGRFKTFLLYKGERAGMECHKINEAFTSQQNCLTDEIMFSSKLDNRIVEIKKDVFIDRDLNSAINIAKKCKGVWYSHEIDFNLSKMFLNTTSGKIEKCLSPMNN